MTAMVELFDGDLWVHYGFFSLGSPVESGDNDFDRSRAGQANGLCGAKEPGVVWCVTGLHTGEVPLLVAWSSVRPPLDPQWEDVVEASVEFSDRDLALTSFDDGVNFAIPERGWHRVRYCASGMDAGREMDSPDEGESAPDRYLLQLWPADPAPDEVIALGSATAAYWHGVARGEEP